MASAMELDGQYAVAQIEKLDWCPLFQGRCIPICRMLAEYLMPQLLPGRFKVWVEQYGRLPNSFVTKEVCFFLLPQEELPVQISDYADLECTAYRPEDGIWTRINYSGSIASFRALREQVFGTSALYSVKIIEPLTDEETYMMQAWVMRYNMIWPYIDYEGGDRRPHDQLRALYENMKVHERLCLTAPLQPPDGVDYVVRNYADGLFSSEITWIAVQDEDELGDVSSESSDELDWD